MQVSDLERMSQAELGELFRRSPAGPIHEGESTGAAIACPGTLWSRLIARFVHRFAWQGKVFTANPGGEGATLQNKITLAGVEAVVARVYRTPS